MAVMSVCHGGDETGNEYLDSKEAAAFLKISEGQLRNLTSQGKVPYYKFHRLNRYKKSELIQMLESNAKGMKNGNQIRRKH